MVERNAMIEKNWQKIEEIFLFTQSNYDESAKHYKHFMVFSHVFNIAQSSRIAIYRFSTETT